MPPGRRRYFAGPARRLRVAGDRRAVRRRRRRRRGTPTSRRERGRRARAGRGRGRDGDRAAVRLRRRPGGWRSFADPEGARVPRLAGRGAHRRRARQRPRQLELERPRDARHRRRPGFYGAVFGWEFDAGDFGQGPSRWSASRATATTWSRSTPACTLAAPQGSGAPEGFSDAIAWMQPPATATARRAGASPSRSPTPTTPPPAPRHLGGTVLVEPFDVPWSAWP